MEPKKKVLKRETAIEVPRCQVIGEETKSREHPMSKKKGKRRT